MPFSSYADAPGVRFHYVRTGTGSPVLLIPGSGGWRVTFDAMAPRLSSRHTVYAVDPPGQSLTEVVDSAFPYGADGIAESIGAFLDAVGVPRVAIVGHSWGGGFALRFAELHPERVSRLALIAPGGLDVKDVWEFRLLRIPFLGELAASLTPTAAVRHLLRKSFAHKDRVPDHLIAEAVRLGRARTTEMLRVERTVRWAETERDLHLVETPVLLLWGSLDRFFPVHLVERFTSRLPAVESHVLENCGHSLHDDCPDRTYALLLPFLEGDDR